MSSSILPALINREIRELDQLVAVCLKRYARRAELVGAGAEDILADSLWRPAWTAFTRVSNGFLK